MESANILAYLAKARAFNPKGRPTPNPTPSMSKNAPIIETHKKFLFFRQPFYSSFGSSSI